MAALVESPLNLLPGLKPIRKNRMVAIGETLSTRCILLISNILRSAKCIKLEPGGTVEANFS